jgi:AraC-like DNA-binding protein
MQRVGFLATVPGLLRALGAEPAKVLAAAGLQPEALDDPEGTIPYSSMGRLLRIAAEQTRTPHFGLLIGQRIDTASLGLVGALMSNAPSVGAALEDLAAHQHRNARGALVYLLPHADQIMFGYAVYQKGIEGSTQIYDGAAAAAFNILRSLMPAADVSRVEIQISHTIPEDVLPYQNYFQTHIRFSTEHTGALFPKSWLTQTIAGADPNRRMDLQGKVAVFWAAGEFDFVARARRALRLGLMTGRISGDQLAARFDLSRRTLHRHLKAQGYSFQELLDETRFELARQLLTDTRLPMAEISAILRYAEQAVFTRAFIQWAGSTPSEWRAAHSADTPNLARSGQGDVRPVANVE